MGSDRCWTAGRCYTCLPENFEIEYAERCSRRRGCHWLRVFYLFHEHYCPGITLWTRSTRRIIWLDSCYTRYGGEEGEVVWRSWSLIVRQSSREAWWDHVWGSPQSSFQCRVRVFDHSVSREKKYSCLLECDAHVLRPILEVPGY